MQQQDIVTDALTGAQFNDYEKLDTTPLGSETRGSNPQYSTQVCNKHAKQYNMQDGLEKGMASGTCGVVGCELEAEHYYYFRVPKRGEVAELEVYGEQAPVQAQQVAVQAPRKKRKRTSKTESAIQGLG